MFPTPAFPFGHARIIEIAGHKVRALRVTYVGELGWELHMPIGAAGEIFDALMEAGEPLGCGQPDIARSKPCGLRRAIAPGVPTSRPMTIPSRRGLAGP